MGWKDGCPSCGGHPNSGGVVLHRHGCVMNEDLGSPWAEPVLAKRDDFYTSLLHTLTIHELRTGYANHPASLDTIMHALAKVISRFPESEIPPGVHDQVLNLVEREMANGP